MSTAHERRTIYTTERWRRLRSAKLDEQPLCGRCLESGLTVGAEIVHHVRSIREGGPAFPGLDGLESLCRNCHQEAHGSELASERRKFRELLEEMK